MKNSTISSPRSPLPGSSTSAAPHGGADNLSGWSALLSKPSIRPSETEPSPGTNYRTLLDVEVALNNRPLSYVEDDIQLPLLTPNLLQFGRLNLLPESEDHQQENPDLRKRARYLARCKDVV